MAEKPVLQTVAHKLRFLLKENMVATIENIRCEPGVFLIEGRLGRHGMFIFAANSQEVKELLALAESLPVVEGTPQELGSEIPVKRREESEKPAKTESKVALTPGWQPPATAVQTDRQKLTKPGEQELFERFLTANADPFKGRKKMTPQEQKEKARILERNDIARSYILAGDRVTVERWISHLTKAAAVGS